MGFYIHKYLPSNIQDILDGPKIIYISNEAYIRSGFPPGYQIKYGEDVEGPYEDIKSLRSESNIYQTLLKTDKKRANLIIQPKHIDEIYYVPFVSAGIDQSYIQNVYKIFTHTLYGVVTNKEVKGIHLFDNRFVKITKLIRFDYRTNIFEAEIIGINVHKEIEIKKPKLSTFFPTKWSLNDLIKKLYTAFYNKTLVDGNRYRGRTAEGILVEFIYSMDGKIKTVYPIFEERNF